MSKGVFLTAVILIFSISNVPVVYGASFGDMFGGKKKQANLLQQKDQECQAQLNLKDQEYQRLVDETKDAQDTVDGLRDKNNTLMQAYEKLVTDQSAITEQLNRLRRDNQQCTQIKESFGQMEQENQAFVQENESVMKEKEVLTATLDSLKSHIGELSSENEQLNFLVKESQQDENIKIKKIRESVKNELENLKSRAKSLSKENDILADQLKESQKRNSRLDKDLLRSQEESSRYQDDLADLHSEHDALKEENRHLAQEASQFPRKFTDLARHNQKLVKDTSHMHYNMGVSFIKSEEYKRAVKEFRKVLELNPKDADANYNLGYIYAEHLVDRPAAVKHFQNYLTYAKDAKDKDWVKKYILTWQTWYGQEKLK